MYKLALSVFRVRMGTGSGQPIPRVIPLKNYKCDKEIPLNCGKGLKPRVGHSVTCTSICLVLQSFTVENQLAELLFLHNASYCVVISCSSPCTRASSLLLDLEKYSLYFRAS